MIPGVVPGAIATAFGAVTAYARAHPSLSNGRIVRSWHLWDTDHAKPIKDLPADKLPLVQARIVGGGSSKIASKRIPGGPAEADYRVLVSVHWDLVIAGSNVVDLVNLGEMIRDVFHPKDRIKAAQLEEAFRDKGINDIRWVKPILPEAGDYHETHLIGSGSMEMSIVMA